MPDQSGLIRLIPTSILGFPVSPSKDKNILLLDKQCTYNVTLRRVRVTIVAMKKQ
jgi:hypothetical protein